MKKGKFIAWLALIVLALVAAETPGEAAKWIDVGDPSWYDNAPNQTHYTIYTAQQLAGLAVLLARGTAVDARNMTITLADNINLSGMEWTPIGENGTSSPIQFSATFDGGGHTISNMTINGEVQYAGLFAYAKAGSTIKNLKLTGVNIDVYSNSSSESYAGSVVGLSWGTVSGCTSSGSVSHSSSNSWAGGIVGANRGGGSIVSGCKSSSSVSSSSSSLQPPPCRRHNGS